MLAEGEVGEIITKGEEASLITIIIQITVTERIESLVTDQVEVTTAEITDQPLEPLKCTIMEMDKDPRERNTNQNGNHNENPSGASPHNQASSNGEPRIYRINHILAEEYDEEQMCIRDRHYTPYVVK